MISSTILALLHGPRSGLPLVLLADWPQESTSEITWTNRLREYNPYLGVKGSSAAARARVVLSGPSWFLLIIDAVSFSTRGKPLDLRIDSYYLPLSVSEKSHSPRGLLTSEMTLVLVSLRPKTCIGSSANGFSQNFRIPSLRYSLSRCSSARSHRSSDPVKVLSFGIDLPGCASVQTG